MKKLSLLVGVYCAVISCTTEGVSKNNKQEKVINKKEINKTETKKGTALNSDNLEINSTKSYDNGIIISWLKYGKGEVVSKGDVLLIDYKVTLKDGSIVDGNHLWKKETFPFVVDYQMQTVGWDFALKNLRVGDFARVLIPSKLARGEKGIKKEGDKGWFVPPNSDNYLTIHIVKKQKPTRSVDGTRVWLFEENKAQKVKFNNSNSVVFHCMISSETNPNFYNSYRTNSPSTLKMSDKGFVSGLKKALINAKKGDRMFVVIPSSEAYGDRGLEGSVKPNEDLLYNILVMDVIGK